MTTATHAPKTIGFIKATYRLEAPTVVSRPGLAISGEVDLEVDRDHNGTPFFPPSTLAGALRAYTHIELGKDDVWLETAFGNIISADGSDVANPSGVWFLATKLSFPYEDSLTVRESTAIDRQRAAAKLSTLREEEFIDAGALCTVFLRVDGENLLNEVAELLSAWHPSIGRSQSHGFGQLAAVEVRSGVLDLATESGLSTWLGHSGPGLVEAAVAVGQTHRIRESPVEHKSLNLRVRIIDPWQGEQAKQTGPDARGSSLVSLDFASTTQRGVLRSGISRILETVESNLRCRGAACDHTFWECRVFGHGGLKGETGQRSGIKFLTSRFTNTARVNRTRIAIDRFTGGGKDGALILREVLTAGETVIRVEENGISEEDWATLCALLRLAVDDINAGLLRFGGSVTVGHGRFEVSDADSVLGDLDAARQLLKDKGVGVA